jgi:quercetin dioxygenase-like cupin family protein
MAMTVSVTVAVCPPGPVATRWWIYVLDGRLRLFLGERSLLLTPGEVAEFDTRVPHWLGADDDQPVELLVIFGKQGERAHLRARPA